MNPVLVIYNPTAGRGRVQAEWPKVENALRQGGIDFEAVATSAPLDAFRLARAAPGKYRMLVSVGGDGTAHEVVNGLMQASGEAETIPMALVPLGSGDDFAKVIPPETAVGQRPFDWQIAVQKIIGGQTRLFDVGRMTGDHLCADLGDGPHYFLNGMDVGFGAHGTLNFITIPRFIKGFSAYMLAIFKTMIRYPLLKITIQLDDLPPFDQSTTMTVITNGRCFGSGFWVCPHAQADDGLFDLMIAQDLSRLKILQLIPKITRGTHIGDPAVSMARAHRITLTSQEPMVVEADGELPYLETHHLTIEVLPRRLTMVV
jgi:YegS/Rv2252/BmrU family lipid kinase